MIKVGPRNLMSVFVQNCMSANAFLRDDVFVDQAVVRQDFLVASQNGTSLMSQIKDAYPDYALPSGPYNLIGSYDGYREVYQNPSISWYNMGSKTPSDLQESYGVSQPTENLQGWYGLKFDLTQNHVMLKCVIKKVDFATPDLPKGDMSFYATTHMPDKTMSDWVDYYVSAEPADIKTFCTAKRLAYPLTAEVEANQTKVKWCWAFVFNKETLEYGVVKGYVRTPKAP